MYQEVLIKLKSLENPVRTRVPRLRGAARGRSLKLLLSSKVHQALCDPILGHIAVEPQGHMGASGGSRGTGAGCPSQCACFKTPHITVQGRQSRRG